MAPEFPDKFHQLEKELEETQQEFLLLLRDIPEIDWDRKIPSEGWTTKQEMFHVAQALGLLPTGIKRAIQGRGGTFLAGIPLGLRNWVNGYIVVPFMSRQATRQSIGQYYQKAHATLIELLASLDEDDWIKGARFPRKYRTVAQIAHRPAEHFEEHRNHIRSTLKIS